MSFKKIVSAMLAVTVMIFSFPVCVDGAVGIGSLPAFSECIENLEKNIEEISRFQEAAVICTDLLKLSKANHRDINALLRIRDVFYKLKSKLGDLIWYDHMLIIETVDYVIYSYIQILCENNSVAFQVCKRNFFEFLGIYSSTVKDAGYSSFHKCAKKLLDEIVNEFDCLID